MQRNNSLQFAVKVDTRQKCSRIRFAVDAKYSSGPSLYWPHVQLAFSRITRLYDRFAKRTSRWRCWVFSVQSWSHLQLPFKRHLRFVDLKFEQDLFVCILYRTSGSRYQFKITSSCMVLYWNTCTHNYRISSFVFIRMNTRLASFRRTNSLADQLICNLFLKNSLVQNLLKHVQRTCTHVTVLHLAIVASSWPNINRVHVRRLYRSFFTTEHRLHSAQ